MIRRTGDGRRHRSACALGWYIKLPERCTPGRRTIDMTSHRYRQSLSFLVNIPTVVDLGASHEPMEQRDVSCTLRGAVGLPHPAHCGLKSRVRPLNSPEPITVLAMAHSEEAREKRPNEIASKLLFRLAGTRGIGTSLWESTSVSKSSLQSSTMKRRTPKRPLTRARSRIMSVRFGDI